MSKKCFHCLTVTHVGNKCISVTDEGHAFLLSIDDANGKFDYLKGVIATGRYPAAMDLVNSCPKMMVGSTIKYQFQQHDAEKLFRLLDKALHH